MLNRLTILALLILLICSVAACTSLPNTPLLSPFTSPSEPIVTPPEVPIPSEPASPDSVVARAFKGWELYSWQEADQWCFVLMLGTNRLKTLDEILSAKSAKIKDQWVQFRAEGLEEIKNDLGLFPPGEFVIWRATYPPGHPAYAKLTLPPVHIVDAIRNYASQCGLNFNVVEPTRQPASETTPIEAPQNAAPPIVRITGNDYTRENMVSLMYLAEDSVLSDYSVEWALSNQQTFIDSAVNQAKDLMLDSGNLEDIMTRLVLHIDQLDFNGKNVGENGVSWTFMLSNKTVQLPYLIEKAKYQGKDVWIMVLNWEVNSEGHKDVPISHVSVIVFEYGSDNVLLAMSCA